ncbi:hypothetical protein BGP77_11550 [Saccharospirillum sp. MSK14-1]|uniref:hypothetical protein n=1 Tax=Saccharospirillum sp. MSK14-1 TaxID=1897632 RepID=UPI000D3924FC|nr:hypothetical protein [Saccharospirillum sp. MSK14-1]PTY38575.1 hypothetical protein BGP77_11550 [Saccharospirillum sp. MSK14-1]
MDQLMSIREFIELRYTPGSAPQIRTVQDRIKRGEIPGVKDGKNWMVNITELSQSNRPATNDVDDIVDLICSGKKKSGLKVVG